MVQEELIGLTMAKVMVCVCVMVPITCCCFQHDWQHCTCLLGVCVRDTLFLGVRGDITGKRALSHGAALTPSMLVSCCHNNWDEKKPVPASDSWLWWTFSQKTKYLHCQNAVLLTSFCYRGGVSPPEYV